MNKDTFTNLWLLLVFKSKHRDRRYIKAEDAGPNAVFHGYQTSKERVSSSGQKMQNRCERKRCSVYYNSTSNLERRCKAVHERSCHEGILYLFIIGNPAALPDLCKGNWAYTSRIAEVRVSNRGISCPTCNFAMDGRIPN